MRDYRSRINASTTRALLYLFYDCYRHGVEDASKVCDENYCKDYVEKMKSSHVFRLVNHDYEMSWKEWRMRMVVYSSNLTSRRDLIRRFLLGIESYGRYYSVCLRVAMDFYVKGVEDFSNYPVYTSLELFLADKHFSLWKKGFEYDVYRNIEKVLEDTQLLVYDRIRNDLNLIKKKSNGYKIESTECEYNWLVEAILFSVYGMRFIS